jgi:hypothetical protein
MVILVLVYNGFMLFMNFLAISAGDWIGVLLLLLFDFFWDYHDLRMPGGISQFYICHRGKRGVLL